MAICRLCQNDRVLRNSHIVPEFLYADLYENRLMMGVTGLGNKGSKPLQKGVREHLFCEACEQHFNEYFEKPFRQQWVLKCPLPSPWRGSEPLAVSVDYATFKLFHLSVLFRASVSTLPTFAEADLGPHQEKIRQMIWDRNPGESWQYPILGLALLHHKTRELVQLVSQVQRGSFGKVRCYSICYGGVQWWIGVASHKSIELESVCLQENGQMLFGFIPWNELGVVQSASRLLHR